MKNALARLICTVAIASGASAAYACQGDFECGFGNKCIKAQGDYFSDGMCVTPVKNEMGTRDFSDTSYSARPREVASCAWDSECSFGYTCVKKSGAFRGLCMK